MKFHKPHRLQGFDYSSASSYLLTIERNAPDNKGTDKIIRATKAMITREIGRSIWQKDFYDVIADTEELFLRCDRYIDENPAAWIERHGEPTAPK